MLPFLKVMCEQFHSPSTSFAPFSTPLDLVSLRETSEAQMFDHMQPATIYLVIIGLEHGMGHIPTEYSSFKDN